MIQKMKRVREAELKILIVFSYFLILSATSMTAFTIASQNIAEFRIREYSRVGHAREILTERALRFF